MLFLRLIIERTHADVEAEDYLKLIIFSSEHSCQDLEVSLYCVSKALTFRRAQPRCNKDVQLGRKSNLSWKSSNSEPGRYWFSNKSQRKIYVYQREKSVWHKQKTHKG